MRMTITAVESTADTSVCPTRTFTLDHLLGAPTHDQQALS
jgi:hypothetical protein